VFAVIKEKLKKNCTKNVNGKKRKKKKNKKTKTKKNK